MTTYNPYAYQGYKVIKRKPVHKYSIKMNIYKWLFCLMTIILIVTSIYLVSAAAGSSTSEGTALQGEHVITVSTGDTLWNIASRHYEGQYETSFAVFLIKQRNGLKEDIIKPGDQLILPESP